MAFKTRNLILSTVLRITFIPCCKIVLMFYNVEYKNSRRFETLNITNRKELIK